MTKPETVAEVLAHLMEYDSAANLHHFVDRIQAAHDRELKALEEALKVAREKYSLLQIQADKYREQRNDCQDRLDKRGEYSPRSPK